MKRHTWTRDLHFYLGLFVGPFILVFAVSTLLLEHARQAPPEGSARNTPTKQSVQIETPGGVGPMEQALDTI